MRAGILREKDLPLYARQALGTRHAQRIDTMVRDIVRTSWACTGETCATAAHISMSPEVADVVTRLREFMFQRIYVPAGQGEEGKRAQDIVEFLYCYYVNHSGEIPEEHGCRNESSQRVAVDYVAGMTDNYAVHVAEQLKPGISGGVFEWRL